MLSQGPVTIAPRMEANVTQSNDPLLQPYQLKHLTLKNRIMSTGHDTTLPTDGTVNDELVAYHRARAKGGAGLIVTGGMAPNREGAVFPGAAGLFFADGTRKPGALPGAVKGLGATPDAIAGVVKGEVAKLLAAPK